MRVIASLFALLTVMATGITCSKNVMPVGDAASDGTTPTDLGASNGDAPPDAALTPPSGVVFPDAPEMSCGGDAGDCELPPSACAEPSCDDAGQCPDLGWVVFYDAPTCVSGQCQFTRRYFKCSLDTFCAGGGCRFNGTLP